MRRAIAKMVRAEIPSEVRKGMKSERLSRHDIDVITDDAAAIMRRSPKYILYMYRLVLGLLAIFLNVPKHVARFRAGRMPALVRRICKKAAFGIMVPVQIALFSSPRTRELLGVCDAGIKNGPPIKVAEPFPEVVETVEAKSLRNKSEYDVIIIGSGPGGAAAAQLLSELGFSVLVCEKGGAATTKVGTIAGAARRYYSYGGQLVAFGSGGQAVPILTAEMVGGSAVVNMGSCPALSPETLKTLAVDGPLFERYIDEARHLLKVRPAEKKLMGRQNKLMWQGCEKLGWPVEVIPRNAVNAGGAATNMHGNGWYSLKYSPDRGMLRSAVEEGAIIARRCDVRRVLIKDERAVGVVAECQGRSKKFFAKRAVIVAGGAVQTPLLLKRSGVAHTGVGKASFFQVNGSVIGMWPRGKEVCSGVGIEQGVICRHFENFGIVLEAVSLPLAVMAPYIPGTPEERWETLREYDRMGVVGYIADARRTQVTVDSVMGDPYITFDLDHDDADCVRNAIVACSQLHFASGAEKVLVPGLDAWFDTVADVEAALKATPDEDLVFASVHLVGTCPMGAGPGAPVDKDGRVKEVEHLYVADGSVIPTALGVNPMLTITALALRTAAIVARDTAKKAVSEQ